MADVWGHERRLSPPTGRRWLHRHDQCSEAVTSSVCALLLVGLVALSGTGLTGAVVSVVLAMGLVALIALGAQRLGQFLVFLGAFTAPMNSVRPLAGADIATFSDIFLLLGFLCLLPRMIQKPLRPHALHLAASALIGVVGCISSLLSDSAIESIGYLLRLLIALTLLPLAFLFSHPTAKQLRWLAWAYVGGQLISLADAAAGSQSGDRFIGLTTHPNFFGMCSFIAAALCLYLLEESSPRWRWWPVTAGGVCLVGVIASGSRAALLASVVVAIIYPVLARSLRAGYLVVLAGILAGMTFSLIIDALGPDSAIGRLVGMGTAKGSDDQRIDNLAVAWHTFLDQPLTGTGFHLETSLAHNGYLEVATAFGIFGMLGYALLLWSLIRVALRSRNRNPLGYVALGYAFISLFNNTLWDRFAWVALSLVLVSEQISEVHRRHPGPAPAVEEVSAR